MALTTEVSNQTIPKGCRVIPLTAALRCIRGTSSGQIPFTASSTRPAGTRLGRTNTPSTRRYPDRPARHCPAMWTITTRLKSNGGDWTTDFDNIKCYDQLKVNAVLNWIQGKTHLGGAKGTVPAIFGMNFQSVSVGQKLLEKGVKGGYSDAAGTPTFTMLGEIKFVDGAIGQFVSELKKQHLLDSTTIIITAKHGQSPIDTNRFFPIPGHSGTNGLPPSALLGPSFLPDSELNQIGATEDDISLLWLSPNTSTLAAVGLLEAGATSAGIGQIFYGPSLEAIYGKPGLPANGGDPRTPDIIVQPNVGVVYTGSLKKQAEHGGFAQDDTNVILLVSNPSLKPRTVTSFVETSQVAPTVLKILGLDPNDLDAVRKEGTAVLPGLHFGE